MTDTSSSLDSKSLGGLITKRQSRRLDTISKAIAKYNNSYGRNRHTSSVPFRYYWRMLGSTHNWPSLRKFPECHYFEWSPDCPCCQDTAAPYRKYP